MRKRVTDTLNRILRGSVNPLLRYALATFLRTTVTTLMTAANAPPGPKRIALIRSLTENLQTPENLEGASKLRWEASLRVMRKQIENQYKVKIEEAERESVESRESLVKLYRNVSELRRTHEELKKMKSERENLETTYTRVSRRLETCLRRKRDMQSCLTQNEALSDLRARVRTVSFFFHVIFRNLLSHKKHLQLWAWRGIYAEYMLGFFRAVRIVNEEKGTSSASMVLRTRQR